MERRTPIREQPRETDLRLVSKGLMGLTRLRLNKSVMLKRMPNTSSKVRSKHILTTSTTNLKLVLVRALNFIVWARLQAQSLISRHKTRIL